MDAYREGGEREKERERVRACTRASLRSHSSTNVELNYSAWSLLHAAPVTHPRPASRNRWWTMAFFPPSSPRRPLHASIRSSVLEEIEREIEGKVALLDGDGLLSFPLLGQRRERRSSAGRCSAGLWIYRFRGTGPVIRSWLRWLPPETARLSLSLSLCPRLSTQPPPLLLPLGCVMEIAFARRGEEGRAWPVLQSNGGSARNYYWANCILTNSKGVRV